MKFSVPGFSLASAINSFRVFGGNSFVTIITTGTDAICVMPENPLIGSNGRSLLSALKMVWPLDVEISV